MIDYRLKSSSFVNISIIKGAVITRPIVLMLSYYNKYKIL